MTTASLGFFSASNLRRVRKEEVAIPTSVRADGLETCLACWKSWMAGDADRDLGIKIMPGLVGDSVASPDIYEAQQEADNRIGAATDAMISSLQRIHVWAIYRACSISTAWRFPNADLPALALEAKNILESKLRSNSATAILF